jgi:hypothetical protein
MQYSYTATGLTRASMHNNHKLTKTKQNPELCEQEIDQTPKLGTLMTKIQIIINKCISFSNPTTKFTTKAFRGKNVSILFAMPPPPLPPTSNSVETKIQLSYMFWPNLAIIRQVFAC